MRLLSAALVALALLLRRGEPPPRRRRLWPWLAAPAAAGVLVLVGGLVPMKASTGHWAVTEWFLRFAMRRSVSTYSRFAPSPPRLDDPALVLKGAGHFETSCRSCHGAPDLPQSRVARRMLPRPPDLAKRVPDRSDRELFFVTRHGLKFTGMPAWTSDARDDEVWAMVAFLRRLPSLDEEGYRRLVRPAFPAVAVPSAAAQSCARCHGADGLGRGDGAFPPLAGQPREYLENALLAYAEGKRRSGIMQPVAAALSTASIRELAAFYAAQPPPAARPARGEVRRGRELALRGVPARGLPACAACHGLETKDTRPEFPSLAGLPAPYLELQLQLLREGRRGGSPYVHLMQAVADRLTAEDIRDAAAFYETLASRRSSPNIRRTTPQATGSK